MSNFLPNELIKRLSEEAHFNQVSFLETHEAGEKVTSIRVNPMKDTHRMFDGLSAVPWCDDAYYLAERPVFTLDPLYHAGCYYVQEASSMFLGHIVEQLGLRNGDVKALDLCAAPGGKSTLLNSYLGARSLLVSNEVIKSRAGILLDNLGRWGMDNVVITNNDPSAFGRLPGYFNLMVVDAPCSGSGMFRKDPGAIDEWSLANVKLCSDRQKRILAESVSALATGGYLIYSTCSYSREENENIVDWIIAEYGFDSVQIGINAAWGIEETQSSVAHGFGYRFYPDKVKGEGFFVAVLRKRAEQASFELRRTKPEKTPVSKAVLEQWLDNTDTIQHFLHGDQVHIFPTMFSHDFKLLQDMLYIRNAGTNIGKWLGKELIPGHDLAMSIHVKADLPAQEVSLATAQQYLRKEQLDRSDFDASTGWCLVRYSGVNLGWVKVLPNRINNYYPKESRIVHL
ncbi:methyltransferase RsmF C-terminal domain-like protein [Sphingobacterium paludis]|uniref:16S rRNA C967 or C1407 C5-methylase (RsmB/RsmF family) n=1 Tax=Sphingobacterium paludis TaxID=1476465 RepID=A0A4R7CV05_9SPHI|nr:RNA methyltransferase [Sphingobacterium paludis]TDS08474.1 16S rRNA C967 or C1407 C5-methylase (RsmB/RsmF family) [Sphingobacterium paludis]